MPLYFSRGDILQAHADAVVCLWNAETHMIGKQSAEIRKKAGIRFRLACRKISHAETGNVRLTRGYRLKCDAVFHLFCPVWKNGNNSESEMLAASCKNILQMANEIGCGSIAFSLPDAGEFGYPSEIVLPTVVDAFGQSSCFADLQITLFLTRAQREQTTQEYTFLETLFISPQAPISGKPTITDDGTITARSAAPSDLKREKVTRTTLGKKCAVKPSDLNRFEALACTDYADNSAASTDTEPLDSLLAQLDESFTEMLLRLIDEHGMTDAQCYKKANIDRKHFSKIRSNPHYKPSKSTALAFVVALELPLPTAKELLQKAGYAFSPSCKFDVIVEYFIEHGQYDIWKINEALFVYDQPLLGACCSPNSIFRF